MMTTTTDSVTDLEEALDTDPSKNTHIVDCPDEWNEEGGAQAWVDKARAEGLEVTALCGHKWIPESDPIKHPICPTCLDIAQIRLAD